MQMHPYKFSSFLLYYLKFSILYIVARLFSLKFIFIKLKLNVIFIFYLFDYQKRLNVFKNSPKIKSILEYLAVDIKTIFYFLHHYPFYNN
jgi:hypothetical protein